MEKIKECYQAYIQSEEYANQDSSSIDEILSKALEKISLSEYIHVEREVNLYCDGIEERGFIAGFRFASRLWAEAVK